MRCGSYSVSQVLVGLHRIGIVGLRQACEKVAAVGLAGRQEIVDFLLSELGADNFIPEGQEEALRTALWREYLRLVGGDFSEFFSEIEVTVGGEPGENRDSLVERCTLVLAEFELRPVVDLVGANEGGGPDPELVIGGTMVARGLPSRKSLRVTIRQRLSDR